MTMLIVDNIPVAFGLNLTDDVTVAVFENLIHISSFLKEILPPPRRCQEVIQKR
jgi:hypothetical protein